MIGKEIHHYKILEKLGEGGMGVVYKAQDTKLDRIVALKFLPTHSLGNDDDRKRFETEAKASAALNHPNIATVYEINDHEGDTFIAMEFVDGDTLEDKIKKAPLKIKDAMKIAKQVADGLAAAHEKDIFHRDIKGSNVMVTAKGVVKIMDFGLAKMSSATMVTKAGITLGTVGYMSPEQSKGGEVDHRTDIWSLGVVFYEMIAGVRPFKGEYETALVYSILNVDPEPLTGLRTGVPMDLEKIINKLLAKDPDERYQNIVELPVDLKNVNLKDVGTSQAGTSQVGTSRIGSSVITESLIKEKEVSVKFRYSNQTVLAFVIGAILFTALTWFMKPSATIPPQPPVKYDIELPPNMIPGSGNGNDITFSPDGRHFVYLANDGEGIKLFLYTMDQSKETIILPGTEGANNPFFSPDGKWVGFYSNNWIRKVPITGENPVPVSQVSASFVLGATWGPENTIIYSIGSSLGLHKVSSSGGALPEQITVPDSAKGETGHRWPEMLPDGKSVLFTSSRGTGLEDYRISVLSLETKKIKELNIQGGNARYASTGHIVYGLPDRLMAVSFDLESLEVTGQPVPIIENVIVRNSGASAFSFSENGSLVYVPVGTEATPGRTLVWVDRQGDDTPVREEKRNYQYPRLSPDQGKIAMEISEDIRIIYILDVESDRLDRFTFELNSYFPTWSPDSKNIIFGSTGTPPSIFLRPVDRSREAKQLLQLDNNIYPGNMSKVSNLFTFYNSSASAGDIWVMEINDSTSAEPYQASSAGDRAPMFSPDDKWIAYVSNEQFARDEVYVRPYPGTGGWTLISDGGGTEPVWGAGMKELFFRQGTKMMTAPIIETEPEFRIGKVVELFDERYRTGLNFSAYDYDPDNDRFLMVKNPVGATGSRINVIVNWFEELKRLAPVKK